MEADFNFHDKLIFGSRVLNAARENGLIPPEQYSEKQSTTEDGSFDKVLQGDISRQCRLSMFIMSDDAVNCYDRIHHTLTVFIFLCIGVQVEYIAAMLCSVQLMKFFLRTGLGKLARYGILEDMSFRFCKERAKEMALLQRRDLCSARY